MAKINRSDRSEPSHARRIWGWIGKIFGTLVLTGFLALLIFACIFASYIKNDLMKQVDFSMDGFALDQTSVIYYQDRQTGQWEELRTLYEKENRVWVGLEEIPLNLRNACKAIEDRRFDDHHGVDWLRTIKASVNMFSGNQIYGASTITQQLIKNLTHEDDVTVRRKLLEICRALELEKNYSKDDILEVYMNIIPLGEGCYGVQAASLVYFGKNVEDLSLAECASIIGITKNPSYYDPYLNAEANKKRQETILFEMLDQGYISETQYHTAMSEELVFVNKSGEADTRSKNYFSYFEDQVINDVVHDLMIKTGYEYNVALRMLQTGGYKIYCTIDPAVQAEVDRIYKDLNQIPKTESSQQLESAIVITDNVTGDIVAMAGGVGEKSGSLVLNRATQSYLQPGSIIKPISVFAPALEMGMITPATVYDDTPYQFSDVTGWPKNMDRTYRGLVTINEAMCYSLNTVAVKLVAEMGERVAFDFARDKMGLTSLVEERTTSTGAVLTDIDLAALALGALNGGGVTVKDMAEAYTAFPSQGQYREARTYTRVLDSNDKVILDNTQDVSVAMSEKTAWYSNYMMMNTVSYGTATGAQLENMQAAGKTGTTGSNRDRWFAGYTPYYTGVVWCGYDVPEEIVLMDSENNPAVTIWQKVMTGVHANKEYAEFKKPTDVVTVSYCHDSGKLATDACRSDPRGDRTIKGELYLSDVPSENCDVHKMVKICGASDHVANEYCGLVPGNRLYEVGLLDIDRIFPISGIVIEDQSYVYSSVPVPPGFHEGAAPVVDAINLECYIHSEEDIPKEEEEEEQEEDENSGESNTGSSTFEDLINGWLNHDNTTP